MSLPTISEVTKRYLFGSQTNPDLMSDDNIREPGVRSTIDVDVNEYMSSGAGRFATGSQFAIVNDFFAGADGLLPGQSMTKAEYAAHLGYGPDDFYGLYVYQKDLADGVDDYAERAYIWNSMGYKISDDAVFEVLPDGTRVIRNMGVEPINDDNFDFSSQDVGIGNEILESWIDPWGIGRAVDLKFTGQVETDNYYLQDFFDEVNLQSTWTVPSDAELFEAMANITNHLWDDGVIRYLDPDSRVIKYGTNSDDTLDASFSANWLAVIAQNWYGTGPVGAGKLEAFANNGFAVIGGDGQDTLTYADAQEALTLSVSTDQAGSPVIHIDKGEGNGTDTGRQIETYVLSEFGDTVIIDDADVLEALAGTTFDALGSSGPGTDDTLDFSAINGPVNISGNSAQFLGFENIYGTAHNDILEFDDPADNHIRAGLGDDRVVAGSGADILEGGEGADVLIGGSGDDTLIAEFNWENDSVTPLADIEQDYLRGGEGNDTYYVSATTNGLSDEFSMLAWIEEAHPAYTVNEAAFQYIDVISDSDGVGVIKFAVEAPDLLLNTRAGPQGGIGNGEGLSVVEGNWLITIDGRPIYDLVDSENRTVISFFVTRHTDDEGITSNRLLFFTGSEFFVSAFIIEDFQNGDFGITIPGYINDRDGSDNDDNFIMTDGPDSVDGGLGSDTLDYSFSTTGIVLNLELSTAGGAATGDTFTNMENVVGSQFNDTLVGSASGNTLVGGDGNDQIDGDAGNDTLDGGVGNDILDGGAGDDRLIGGAGEDQLYGGDGDDTLVIDIDDTDWSGDAGYDTLYFEGDQDFTFALAAGSIEAVYSGGGNDTLYGEDGVDNYIDGGAGNDFIQAFAGNDYIVGGAGADELLGGDGDDTVVIDADDVYWEGADGYDTLIYDGNEDFSYALAQGEFEAVQSGGGNDSLYGTAGNNDMNGGAGNDIIFGYEGNDRLVGGAGDDFITGGIGADTFVFADGEGVDWIDDFDVAEDKIDLSAVSGISDFSDVLALANDYGSGTTWIAFDNDNEIRLEGVALASLSASNFIFAA